MDLSFLFPEQPKRVKTAHSTLPGRDEPEVTWNVTSAMDDILQGRRIGGAENEVLQDLTDVGKRKKALRLPVKAGTRVRFAHNLGAVLTYPSVPDPGVLGTVVTVRAAGGGDSTVYHGRVMVSWDTGLFMPVMPEHLREVAGQKQAKLVRLRVAEGMDLSNLFEMSKKGTDLVHKATQDLWSFHEEDGAYFIERLFDANGGPLKQ